MITPQEAIDRLEEMQRQIVHGKNTFGEIADVIRNLKCALETLAQLQALLRAAEGDDLIQVVANIIDQRDKAVAEQASFTTVALGGTCSVTVNPAPLVNCRICGGFGYVTGPSGITHYCEDCNGSGKSKQAISNL